MKDDKIEELKKCIVEEHKKSFQKYSEQASEQEYRGERYPAKWITLERSIDKLKDRGEKVILLH
jgi:hypothetical protein